jgi:phage shock protein A
VTRPVSAPRAVHPRTGEILTPDDLAGRILVITDAIEDTFPKLTEKVHELARVTSLYDETYDTALLASKEKNKEQREADARLACRTAHTPLGHPLAKRKTDLEHDVRAIRDELHNLRAVLSGYQSAAKPLQAAFGAYAGSGAA